MCEFTDNFSDSFVASDAPRLKEKLLGSFELATTFRFGGIPYAKAEDSIRLFGKEVLPVLKTWRGLPCRVVDMILGRSQGVRRMRRPSSRRFAGFHEQPNLRR